IRRVAAARRRIVAATQLGDVAARILLNLATGDEIRIAQAHFDTGRKPEELLWRILHEIVLLDENLAAKAHAPRARAGIVRVIDGFELLARPLIVLDYDFQRPQHRHAPLRRLVQTLADGKIQHAEIDQAV